MGTKLGTTVRVSSGRDDTSHETNEQCDPRGWPELSRVEGGGVTETPLGQFGRSAIFYFSLPLNKCVAGFLPGGALLGVSVTYAVAIRAPTPTASEAGARRTRGSGESQNTDSHSPGLYRVNFEVNSPKPFLSGFSHTIDPKGLQNRLVLIAN